MNEDIIQDLKQFIATTVSQQTASLATKDDITRIENKIDQVQTAIEHSAIGYTSAVDEQVQDHEKRLAQLEKKAA